MVHQLAGPLLRVGRLEHVVAHEVVEVAHRLHRHGLVEELHRLLGLDAEEAAHGAAVLREMVAQLRSARPELAPQAGQVGAEVGEVGSDAERAFGGDEQSLRLPVAAVAHPEHLGDRHLGLVAGVAEHAEDDRERAAVAQRDRLGGPGRLVAFGLVVAEDVGAQRPLPGVGAGRLVVRDPLAGQQQRRDGVDQRRFPRADVARQQRVVAAQVQPRDLVVERAPVVELEAVQAVSRPRAACCLVEFQRRGQGLHQASPRAAVGSSTAAATSAGSSSGTSPVSWAAYSPRRRSSSASHLPSTNALRMRRTS